MRLIGRLICRKFDILLAFQLLHNDLFRKKIPTIIRATERDFVLNFAVIQEFYPFVEHKQLQIFFHKQLFGRIIVQPR